MSIKKKYAVTFSTKLPRGSIISYSFGTEVEEENVDPEELYTRVEKLTINDLKKCLAKDKVFKEVMAVVKEDIKHSKKRRKSDEEFDNL